MNLVPELLKVRTAPTFPLFEIIQIGKRFLCSCMRASKRTDHKAFGFIPLELQDEKKDIRRMNVKKA